MDNPSYSLTVTKTDGSSFTLDFGLESSVSYTTYVKLSDSDAVYAVYTSDLSSFEYTVEDFVSRKIIPDLSENADFKSISFSGADYAELLSSKNMILTRTRIPLIPTSPTLLPLRP